MPGESSPEYTYEELVRRMHDIAAAGYHLSHKSPGNDGAVGNLLEQLLGIPENNLRVADFGKYEIKAQRSTTSSLLTLFHRDPQPREPIGIVQSVLVAQMGWAHDRAGLRSIPTRLSTDERSFRATLSNSYSVRGLRVVVDRATQRIVIDFDPEHVAIEHHGWRDDVLRRLARPLRENPPYWAVADVLEAATKKINTVLYALATVRREPGKEFFHYERAWLLEGILATTFLDKIESGTIKIDFDARTGHNHGTKFRIKSADFPGLYQTRRQILGS